MHARYLATTPNRPAAAASSRPSRRTDAARLLSRAEERALLAAWQESGDRVALERLLAAFRRLVLSVVRRFSRYGVAAEDLAQEGMIGLVQAASRFDLGRDVRFSTYALWWVRAAIQDHVLRNWSIVRIGTTATQKRLFFTLSRARARLAGAVEVPAERLAAALGVKPAEVAAMAGRLGGRDVSLNAAADATGSAEWQNFLADPAPLPDEVVGRAHDGGPARAPPGGGPGQAPGA